MPEPLLAVRELHAWYGESHILHGVDFDVHAGEVVTLLGRNGAGKTTTLKSVMGIIARRSGAITFEGKDISRASSDSIARLGVAFCPDGRHLLSCAGAPDNGLRLWDLDSGQCVRRFQGHTSGIWCLALSANGSRLRLTRDIGQVTMDVSGVEQVNVVALGGADTVTVNDLTGTDVTEVNLNLQGSGGAGDGAIAGMSPSGVSALTARRGT